MSTIPNNRRIILEGEDIEEISDNDQLANLRGARSAASAVGATGVASRIDNQIQNVQDERSTGSVIFDVQPSTTETGSVSYFEIGDIRQAANMLVYMGSPSREFSINGRFVSRSVSEAEKNLKYVRHLRSWRMPEKETDGINLKTPSRLRLKGYGNWFNAIHVRITSLTIEMPEDVDYIRAGKADVPIVWPVTVSLKETRSIDELRQFNINSFREGTLGGW